MAKTATPLPSRGFIITKMAEKLFIEVEAATAKVKKLIEDATTLPVIVPLEAISEDLVVQAEILKKIDTAGWRRDEIKNEVGNLEGYSLR